MVAHVAVIPAAPPPASHRLTSFTHAGTIIAPESSQPFFESAANAAGKGQSQFYTPLDLGRELATPLPRCRPNLVDLNCGAGHLLQASAGRDTALLLGSDIDPCRGQSVEGATLPLQRITA